MKWKNKSYWKCSWLSELRVRGWHQSCPSKISNVMSILSVDCDVLLMHVQLPAHVLPVVLQLDVHQQHILRCYVRRNNMDNPPPQSSPHKHKRIRKRSTSVVNEDKMDRLETSLLAAGVKPEWLKVHRIISKRCAPCCGVLCMFNASVCTQFHWMDLLLLLSSAAALHS